MKRHEEHKGNCKCPICTSNIREERQYALLRVGEQEFTLDADEAVLLDKFWKSETKEHPVFPTIEPAEDTLPVLAYGVLIAQPRYANERNWPEVLDASKNFVFGTLEDEKLYLSTYQDFRFYDEDVSPMCYTFPCALLLETSLDLTKKREYGFGYTAFELFSDCKYLDNVLSRGFMFCLGGVDSDFDGKDLDNWAEYIDKEKLFDIAKRLF